MTSPALWYLSRATGVVDLALLTLVVVLGVVTAGRRAPHSASSAIVVATHRWLSLGMSVFLLAHVATAVLDSYVDISWVAALVPFTSGYERLWVGFGTIAFDLLLALLCTSLLRGRLPEPVWRFVHRFAYAMWPIALAHGFAMGTADQPVLRDATIACGAVGVIAIAWRLLTPDVDAQRRAHADRLEWT